MHSGVHTLPAKRAMDVRCITCEEHSPIAVLIYAASMQLECCQPMRIGKLRLWWTATLIYDCLEFFDRGHLVFRSVPVRFRDDSVPGIAERKEDRSGALLGQIAEELVVRIGPVY